MYDANALWYTRPCSYRDLYFSLPTDLRAKPLRDFMDFLIICVWLGFPRRRRAGESLREREKNKIISPSNIFFFFFCQYPSNDRATCPLWNLIGRKTTRQNGWRVISSCPYLPPLNAFYVTFILRTSVAGGWRREFSTRIYRKQATRKNAIHR